MEAALLEGHSVGLTCIGRRNAYCELHFFHHVRRSALRVDGLRANSPIVGLGRALILWFHHADECEPAHTSTDTRNLDLMRVIGCDGSGSALPSRQRLGWEGRMSNAAGTQARATNQFDFTKVHRCRIHPGIGIARVGNSNHPDGYFVGPEAPRDPHKIEAPDGSYKDADGRIKRQAARFRIYAYDEAGKNLGELPLCSKDREAGQAARVEWKVHLANKKGAWYKFFPK